jgi:hypothetical protein
MLVVGEVGRWLSGMAGVAGLLYVPKRDGKVYCVLYLLEVEALPVRRFNE